jgi:two-component system sensor histidine kinase/response regulator
MRVLVVGNANPIAKHLQDVGHCVTPVDECGGAVQALQFQRYDAVVLGRDVRPGELATLSQQVREINRRSSAHTAVLGVTSQRVPGHSADLDGYLPDQAGPEALSAALTHLSMGTQLAERLDGSQQELPVLRPEELQEQVAYDSELLLELIDLYFEERRRQSAEMRQALEEGDFQKLSRLAHTIKGSLGNLHAPSAHAEAQLLELAAGDKNSIACGPLFGSLERKLDLLETELNALTRTLRGAS